MTYTRPSGPMATAGSSPLSYGPPVTFVSLGITPDIHVRPPSSEVAYPMPAAPPSHRPTWNADTITRGSFGSVAMSGSVSVCGWQRSGLNNVSSLILCEPTTVCHGSPAVARPTPVSGVRTRTIEIRTSDERARTPVPTFAGYRMVLRGLRGGEGHPIQHPPRQLLPGQPGRILQVQ